MPHAEATVLVAQGKRDTNGSKTLQPQPLNVYKAHVGVINCIEYVRCFFVCLFSVFFFLLLFFVVFHSSRGQSISRVHFHEREMLLCSILLRHIAGSVRVAAFAQLRAHHHWEMGRCDWGRTD